jgi:hypothetical protein
MSLCCAIEQAVNCWLHIGSLGFKPRAVHVEFVEEIVVPVFFRARHFSRVSYYGTNAHIFIYLLSGGGQWVR